MFPADGLAAIGAAENHVQGCFLDVVGGVRVHADLPAAGSYHADHGIELFVDWVRGSSPPFRSSTLRSKRREFIRGPERSERIICYNFRHSR